MHCPCIPFLQLYSIVFPSHNCTNVHGLSRQCSVSNFPPPPSHCRLQWPAEVRELRLSPLPALDTRSPFLLSSHAYRHTCEAKWESESEIALIIPVPVLERQRPEDDVLAGELHLHQGCLRHAPHQDGRVDGECREGITSSYQTPVWWLWTLDTVWLMDLAEAAEDANSKLVKICFFADGAVEIWLACWYLVVVVVIKDINLVNERSLFLPKCKC